MQKKLSINTDGIEPLQENLPEGVTTQAGPQLDSSSLGKLDKFPPFSSLSVACVPQR